MEELGGHLPGLDRVGDPLAVHRVHGARGVADDEHPRDRLRRAVHAHRKRTGEHPAVGGLLGDPALLGKHLRERVEQSRSRDVLEVPERAEQAGAEVHAAVGHREEPAVAGEEHVALPQVEPGLEPRTAEVGRAVVATGGDAEGAGLVAADAGGSREAARGAVRRDREPRVDLGGLAHPCRRRPSSRRRRPTRRASGAGGHRSLPSRGRRPSSLAPAGCDRTRVAASRVRSSARSRAPATEDRS